MKSLVIISLLLFASFQSTSAQSGFGVLAGVNLASSTYPDLGAEEPSVTPYLHFGAHAEFQMNEKTGLQGDLLFSQKGFRIKNGFGGDTRLRYGYVVLVPEFFLKPVSRIGIGAGFHFGVNLSEQQDIGDGWIDTGSAETIKKTDFGINGSARVFIKPIYVQVRYLLGLADIGNVSFTDVNGNPIPDAKQQNRTLQISIGYLLE